MEFPIKVELIEGIDSPTYSSYGYKKLKLVFQVPPDNGFYIMIGFGNETKNIFIDLSNYKNIEIDILSNAFYFQSNEITSFYLKYTN